MSEGECVETVLVVDDNEPNRILARDTLVDEGFEVLLAKDGPEALALFAAHEPDCVVLDVRMPGMDGFAVCEKIRVTHDRSRAPVLFLTALRDVDTFDRALRAGGDDFLTKPVRPAELVVRVRSALELRRLNAEIGAQFEAMKRQRDELIRLHLQKERLIAFVVHDLKNPVAALSLHAQLLLRERTLSDVGRESAEEIIGEAQQLNRMIMNLLDLAKGDEGRLVARRKRVALSSLVDAVFTELALHAAAREVELVKGTVVPHVEADEDLLRRLLANLVDNGLRHAPRRTKLFVTAHPAEDRAVEVRVVDQGAGIAPDHRERVFMPFEQLEVTSERRGSGGRGLGLAFCKLVAEAHDGRIWIEDADPGAIFCVRLADALER